MQSGNPEENQKIFFDIHMHTMNLSHPNILAFVGRISEVFGIKGGITGAILLLIRILMVIFLFFLALSQIKFITVFLTALALLILILSFTKPGKRLTQIRFKGINSKIKTVKNLLAVMENDSGSFFQLMEECVKHDNTLFTSGELRIGGNIYKRFVLVPLIMDFGYKNIQEDDNFHYGFNKIHKGWGKPIKEQVIDVFNGIKSYKNYCKTKGAAPLFEIYPFMGLNSQNYEFKEIEDLLNKYFGDYQSLSETRSRYSITMQGFDGDIDKMRDCFFAGIKFYPPLGFDPWPEEQDELKKVEFIYKYCCDKKIPVTTHCNNGGFKVASDEEVCKYTSPYRWEKVLASGKYDKLKLNLAHFGCKLENLSDRVWFKKVIELVLKYENVYTDISFCGVSPDFYGFLKKELDKFSEEDQKKIKNKILFGSDFMINLLSVDSYKKYLDIFSQDENFSSSDKNLFCSINPQRFLF